MSRRWFLQHFLKCTHDIFLLRDSAPAQSPHPWVQLWRPRQPPASEAPADHAPCPLWGAKRRQETKLVIRRNTGDTLSGGDASKPSQVWMFCDECNKNIPDLKTHPFLVERKNTVNQKHGEIFRLFTTIPLTSSSGLPHQHCVTWAQSFLKELYFPSQYQRPPLFLHVWYLGLYTIVRHKDCESSQSQHLYKLTSLLLWHYNSATTAFTSTWSHYPSWSSST